MPMTTAPCVRSRIAILGVALALASGCADEPTRPNAGVEPDEAPKMEFGLMEITITGLSIAGEMSATARSVPGAVEPSATVRSIVGDGATFHSLGRYTGVESCAAVGPGMISKSMNPLEEGERRGLQLDPLTLSSFTYGERGNGGQRYLSATFRVRNASADGVPYTDRANNVTLVAVATDATIGETPIARLRRFDGTAAPASLADELRPTGAVAIDGEGRLNVQTADVLQAFTEAEAADLATAAGLDNVFPYGFMVRGPERALDRRLGGNPPEEEFAGVVTLAFRVPLAADPADDPFEIRVMVLAVSDTESRITQSFEEQTVCPLDFEERAIALAASTVTLLDGGIYSGLMPVRHITQLRTAGTAGAPTATLPDPVTAAYPPPPEMIDLSGATDVVPIVWDIVRAPNTAPADRRFRVRYGYYNPLSTAVTRPIGIDNFFVPGAADRGQPKEYLPGLHTPPNGGFAVTFSTALTPVLNWSLNNSELASAEPGSTGKAPPPCGFRT